MAPTNLTALNVTCPQCGGRNFTHWHTWHPVILHWLLNPGLCLLEVPFGVRLPKVMLLCNRCDTPVEHRSYVLCPACDQLHSSQFWSKSNGFGHWFGLACPTCDAMIPCHWNVWSRLIIALTTPLWILPVLLFKRRWIAREKRRVREMSGRLTPQPRHRDRVLTGVLGWGGAMWFAFSAWELLKAWRSEDWNRLWLIPAMAPLWALAGLAWGLMMQRFDRAKRGRNSDNAGA